MKIIYIDENLEKNIIGGLIVSHPHYIQDAILHLQDIHHFFDEIKFSKVAKTNLGFYKEIIKLLCSFEWEFSIMIFPKINIYSYSDFLACLNPGEAIAILDHIPNSKMLNIEDIIATHNKKIIFSMRENSKSNILLQMSDLLLGVTTRDPGNTISIYKKDLIEYFHNIRSNQQKLRYLKNDFYKKNAGSPIHYGWFTSCNNETIYKKYINARDFKDKNVKIYMAGHRGLVGSAILRQLETQGYTNIITKTHTELDLTDANAVASFFEQEKPEFVFLAAAKVGGIMANNTYPADFLYQNLQIQNNVIHQAYLNGVTKLLFLGSSCIYPKNCPQPIKEEYLLTGPLEPTNEPYATAKITGIKMCQSYNRQYRMNFIACMPTNLYGPGDNFDLQSSHVLPALIRKFHEAKVLQSPEVSCRGTGEPMREFLYVDDMANGCIHLMKSFNPTKEQNEKGDIFVNIGTGEDITIKELAELVGKIVGYEGTIVWDTTKPNGTMKKLLDVGKLEQEGWKAKIGLEEGIQKAYQRFLDNYK